jgi:ABC-type antimicrobial peptide transport system permease subunit
MVKNNKMKNMGRLKKFKEGIFAFVKNVFFLFKFMILLFFVFIGYFLSVKKNGEDGEQKKRSKIIEFLGRNYEKVYVKILKILDKTSENEVKASDLILLALKNLSAKKSRTIVTIGGMAIGFGAVILLLSLGYGFERLVISQVATLTEMKQVDVNTTQGSPLSLNFSVMEEICALEETETLIPILTLVSKVQYNNAVSDILTYAVTTRYLTESRIDLVRGSFYEDEIDYEGSAKVAGEKKEEQDVLGVTSKLIASNSNGHEIYKIKYSINPLVWKPVYREPDEESEIVGYTKRSVGLQDATEVWGGSYPGMIFDDVAEDYFGNTYARWIKDSFPLWEVAECETEKDPSCIDDKYKTLLDNTAQVMEVGYITQEKTGIERYELTYQGALEAKEGSVLDEVEFGLKENFQTNMYFDYEETSVRGTVLNEGQKDIYRGYLVSGGEFQDEENGNSLRYWVKGEIGLWSTEVCEGLCDIYYTKQKQGYVRNTLTVYFKVSDVVVDGIDFESLYGDVLGETDDSGSDMLDIDNLQELEDEDIDWVQIAMELGGTETVSVDVKTLPEDSQKVALVNLSMLELLGISINDAVGEEFETTFVYDSKLFGKSNYLAESELVTYEIIGVVSDDRSPAYYIPFNDAFVEGLQNVSSLKVITNDAKDVEAVRNYVEGIGFQTSSVTDTVERIGSLFQNLRLILLVVGLIALAVASLGMFNTLTVSLLEKTREVGLLKTMGMKSEEIKILFLAESIIMSFIGGLAGMILGFLVGQAISLLISIIAITQGQGFINVSHIPWFIVLALMMFSSIVGIFTGWYPAKRAKGISALNALRYE